MVAAIVLIFLFFVVFVDLAAVAQQLTTSDPWGLLAASAFLVAGLLAYAVRWRYLLANQPALSHTFHAANVGHGVNILIPARLGEAARIGAMASGEAVSVAQATSSFVVERLFEQLMRFFALAAAIAFGAGLEISPAAATSGIALLALSMVGIFWLLRHREAALARAPIWLAKLPKLSEAGARSRLAEFLDTLAQISTLNRLAVALLWSLIPWLLFWGFFYTALIALSESFPAGDRMAVSLGALALSPPSAPTQPGLFHASVVAPLAVVGYSSTSLTAYAVILHLLEMLWMLGFGVLGLARTGLSARTLFGKPSR
jgi:uncharacterized protein (TIRG00374 family)